MAALYFALEDLVPSDEQLNNDRQRAQWLQRAQTIKPVAHKLFALVEKNGHLYGPVSTEFVGKCK